MLYYLFMHIYNLYTSSIYLIYDTHTHAIYSYYILPKSEKDQLVKIRVTPRASASTDILLLLPILAKPLLMAPRSAQVCVLTCMYVCICILMVRRL